MCEGKTQINLGTRMKGSLRQRRAWPNKHMGQGGSYLHFLYHLLAKRADLGGTSDYHVLRTLILAGDPVEGAAFILDVGVEVCLEEDTGKTSSGQMSQQGPCSGWSRGESWGHRPGSRARKTSGGPKKNWESRILESFHILHTRAWHKVRVCCLNNGKRTLSPALVTASVTHLGTNIPSS